MLILLPRLAVKCADLLKKYTGVAIARSHGNPESPPLGSCEKTARYGFLSISIQYLMISYRKYSGNNNYYRIKKQAVSVLNGVGDRRLFRWDLAEAGLQGQGF
jgi:hypothetical protein